MIPIDSQKVDSISDKIVEDYLSFKRYPKTLLKLQSNIRNLNLNDPSLINADTKMLEERKKVVNLIEDKSTIETLKYLTSHKKLDQPILKQSFLEAVEREDFKSAIEIAENYSKIYGIDEFFSEIGYDHSSVQKLRSKTVLDNLALAEDVNEELFYDSVGRNVMLIDLLWYHHKKSSNKTIIDSKIMGNSKDKR